MSNFELKKVPFYSYHTGIVVHGHLSVKACIFVYKWIHMLLTNWIARRIVIFNFLM